MVSNTEENITINDTELYDRQIRIWGLDAQKRLRQADVLIIGMNGLTTEIIKNIALTGVKTIIICDTELLTEDDRDTNYFAPESAIGTNRADASLAAIKDLNPNVQVLTIKKDVSVLPEDFLMSFTVILATECDQRNLEKLDDISTKYNIKFFTADMFGKMAGYFFMNLNVHKYVEEVKKESKPAEKKETEAESSDTQVVPRLIKFESLKSTMEKVRSKLLNNKDAKDIKRLAPLIVSVMTFQVFRNKFKANPTYKTFEDFKKVYELVINKYSFQSDLLNIEELVENHFSTGAPDCAILGGILAQEIISSISANVKPQQSLFFYGPKDFTATFLTV